MGLNGVPTVPGSNHTSALPVDLFGVFTAKEKTERSSMDDVKSVIHPLLRYRYFLGRYVGVVRNYETCFQCSG
jgi:hypothetical protein